MLGLSPSLNVPFSLCIGSGWLGHPWTGHTAAEIQGAENVGQYPSKNHTTLGGQSLRIKAEFLLGTRRIKRVQSLNRWIWISIGCTQAGVRKDFTSDASSIRTFLWLGFTASQKSSLRYGSCVQCIRCLWPKSSVLKTVSVFSV